MPQSAISGSASLARRATVAAVALLTIGTAGVYFSVKGANNSNSTIQQHVAGSGKPIYKLTSSGHLALSGSVTVGNRTTGTASLIINSLNGGVFCMPNTSGVMKAVVIIATTVTVRTPVGTECTPP